MILFKKIILFFILLTITNTKVLSQNKVQGVWIGTIKEIGNEFQYTLNINLEEGNNLTGTSISKSNKFYCETTFNGSISKGQMKIFENKIQKTNYHAPKEICLMSLHLSMIEDSLIGTFTSHNNTNNNCGSGYVKLIRKEDTKFLQKTKLESNIPAKTPPNITPIQTQNNSNTQINTPESKEKTKNNEYHPNFRITQLAKTLYFKEDSISLAIYDNATVDGDTITLIINKKVILYHNPITAKPIKLNLTSRNNVEFLIEFYADNLGEIPPNTGLLIISTKDRKEEVRFNSDLEKTSAIKIFLNQRLP